MNQNVFPKINQNVPPNFEPKDHFWGQKIDQFWGHKLGPFLGHNLCPRKCARKCPPNFACVSKKNVLAITDFQTCRTEILSDRCHQIAVALRRVFRSAGTAADARRIV